MAKGRKRRSGRRRHRESTGPARLPDRTPSVRIRLLGTEVKSIRAGRASLAEGWVRAETEPPSLRLHGVHVAEYPPAGPHQAARADSDATVARPSEGDPGAGKAQDGEGATLVPLKIYFKDGRAKLLVGIAEGRKKADKRQDIAKKEAKRDIERELRRRR